MNEGKFKNRYDFTADFLRLELAAKRESYHQVDVSEEISDVTYEYQLKTAPLFV